MPRAGVSNWNQASAMIAVLARDVNFPDTVLEYFASYDSYHGFFANVSNY